MRKFIIIIFYFLNIIQFIKSDSIEDFLKYFECKTDEELLYILLTLEDITGKKIKNKYMKKRNDLTIEIKKIIDYNLGEKNINNIEVFDELIEKNYKFKNWPNEKLFNINTDRFLLIRWAINLYKYLTQNKVFVGGIIDYINYLKESEIVDYINKNLNEELNNIEKRNNIILNIKKFKTPINIFEYVSSKSNNNLIQYIYNFEYYSGLIKGIPVTSSSYVREQLYTLSHEELLNIIYDYLYEFPEITKYNSFIQKIENKNYFYIEANEFVNGKDKNTLCEISLACEYYNRKNKKIYKSLRKIRNYISLIPSGFLNKYISEKLKLYPELLQGNRTVDIYNNHKYIEYDEVQDFLTLQKRIYILKYYLNLVYKYNEGNKEILDNIFYFSNKLIYSLLVRITNKYKDLQNKISFRNIVELNKNNIITYLESRPRFQLIKIVNDTINYYLDINKLNDEDIEFSYIMNQQSYDLISYITLMIASNETSKFMLISKKNFFKNSPAFGDITDFLRAVNINYLKKWLFFIELYFRKIQGKNNIMGGIKNSYLNEISKNKIIEIIYFYFNEYEELSEPKNFIKIIQLTNTSHELIVNLKDPDLNETVQILDGYSKRKNIQINFGENNIYDLYDCKYYRNQCIYFLFRLLAIFPELNIKTIFKLITQGEDKEINPLLNYTEIIYNKLSKSNLLYFAKNIQKYYNSTNIEKEKIDLENGNINLKQYIMSKINDDKLIENYPVIYSLLFYNETEYLFFDNYKNYFSRNSNRIEKIYENARNYLFKKYKIKLPKHQTKYLDEIISNFTEFQDPRFFFFIIYPLNQIEIEIFNNYDKQILFKYAIVCFILNYEKNSSNIKLFDYKYFYQMNKNELIIYIHKSMKDLNIPFENMDYIMNYYISKYYLNYNEVDIYYLTIY